VRCRVKPKAGNAPVQGTIREGETGTGEESKERRTEGGRRLGHPRSVPRRRRFSRTYAVD